MLFKKKTKSDFHKIVNFIKSFKFKKVAQMFFSGEIFSAHLSKLMKD